MDLCETHLIGSRTRERLVSPSLCPELSSHRIILAGQTLARRGYRFIRIAPKISQIFACIAGAGEVLLDGTWTRCSAGFAYLTPPGALHAYRAVTREAWEVCWVTYRESEGLPPIVRLPQPALIPIDPRPLNDSLTGLHREMIGPAEPAILHHWTELVQANVRRIVGPAAPEERLRPLWEAVEADLARPWSVETLAEIVNISGEHLRRLCVRQFHHSPMHHVTHLRMQRATELLGSTQRRVQDIAQAVGYDDPFAFATAFKRHRKITPTRYRSTATQRME